MLNKVQLFGEIEKVEKQDDGTIIVKGIASTEVEDSQGEIVKGDAMRAAIPDYMKFGAVREMHQPMAAGTALKCYVDDANVTHLEAHVVDPTAVKKVLNKVYKGFSIGGGVTQRDTVNKTTILGLKLTEISLVDRPANPEAVLSFGKVDGVEEPAPVKKAGAKFSKATKAELECMHKAVAEVNARFEKLGYAAMKAEDDAEDDAAANHTEPDADDKDKGKEIPGNAEDKEKSDKIEELTKLHADTVTKAEELTTKVASLTGELAKAQEVIVAKDAEIARLKAEPAAPKGSLTVVHKAGEKPADTPSVEPIRKGDGTIDEVATAVKLAQTARV